MKKGIVCIVTAFLAAGTAMAQQDTLRWSLNDCIDYAMAQNIQLRKSHLMLEESKVDVKTAKAALFPSLSFSSNQNVSNRPYQPNSTSVSGTELISSNSKTTYMGSYGLNASWTVWDGNRKRNTLRQQEMAEEIAALSVEEQENLLKEEIMKLYVQILYASESVSINEGTLELSRAQCERGRQLLEAGSISKSEQAQLEAQLSNDNYQLVAARATLADYELQLKQLLELDGSQELELVIPEADEALVTSPLPDKRYVYGVALGNRPEIKSSDMDIQSTDLSIKIAKAGYMPNISLDAGISTNHSSGSGLSFGEQLKDGWNNSIGLTLSIPIFQNRQTKSAVEKARIQYQTSQLDKIDAEKNLYQTIESMWLDAVNAQEQFVAADSKLKSSEVSYSLVNEQFNLGMKNTVELLTEKNNLLSAQQERIQAKYMAMLNRSLLMFYAGEEIDL